MTRAKKAVQKNPSRARKVKAAYAPPPGHVLALRVCAAGGLSWNDFRWPAVVGGYVESASWDPSPICGYGLHGWLWGSGSIKAAPDTVVAAPDSLWYVLEIAEADCVQVTESGGGKIKCRRCRVVYVGARDEAVRIIAAHAPPGTVALFGTATAGDGGTATAGYRGTATAGDGGTATAGHRGTATAGDGGTATAGDGGTATAGEGGSISIRWWDGDAARWRLRSGDVGAKEPLQPGVKYRLNARGEFEEAK